MKETVCGNIEEISKTDIFAYRQRVLQRYRHLLPDAAQEMDKLRMAFIR